MKLSYITGDLDCFYDMDGGFIMPEEFHYSGDDSSFWTQQVIFLEGVDGAASISFSIRIHDSYQEDYTTMTLLIPDRDRDNQEDFVWCLPVDNEKWTKWFALSEKFKGVTPPQHGGGVHYVNRVEGTQVRTVLMLPEAHHSDDDVVHACAFLRMAKQLTCRIFVLRSSDAKPMSTAETINKIAGTDPKMVENLEDGDVEGEKEQGA